MNKDRKAEQQAYAAQAAARSAGHQLMALMAGEIEEREPQKSTGKSRMAAVVARRAANWTKKRPEVTPDAE